VETTDFAVHSLLTRDLRTARSQGGGPMTDFLSRRERSALMSRIRGKGTGPERLFGRAIASQRLPIRKHVRQLPGTPDFVVRDCRVAVFIDGDFWHGRGFDQWNRKLDAFWRTKIFQNIKRDRKIDRRLRALGWGVVHVWGSDVQKSPEKCVKRILTVRARKLREG